MDPRYANWIAAFERKVLTEVRLIGGDDLSDEEKLRFLLRGWCHTASADMVKAFPELRLVRGHYNTYCEHWWCKTADGTVIDPTAKQFTKPDGTYTEYTGPDPYGKCMNCAGYVWTKEFSGACCEECEKELRAYYS